MPILLLLTFFLAPTYALNFKLGFLPLNLLLLWVGFIWLIFIGNNFLKKSWLAFFLFLKTLNPLLLKLIAVFFLSGVVGLFWSGVTQAKLGQFIVLFLQPISLFFVAGFVWHQSPWAKRVVPVVFYLMLGLMGLLAIMQYTWLWTLPKSYWGNSLEPKRAVAFFSHPNFFALFCAPLLAFLLSDLGFRLKDIRKNWLFITSWIIGTAGLGLSLSRAGWLGFGLASLVYLFFFTNRTIKKMALGFIVAILIIIVSVPNFRWRVIMPFYGEKSSISRLSLWKTGWKGIKESPVLGMGLTGFSNNWDTLNTNQNLDNHNYPHNIFLTLWLETGILGGLSFCGLCLYWLKLGKKKPPDAWKLGVALFILTVLFQGLLDNPYFKNDLALIFWLIISLGV